MRRFQDSRFHVLQLIPLFVPKTIVINGWKYVNTFPLGIPVPLAMIIYILLPST
jgi:hypothetical protein